MQLHELRPVHKLKKKKRVGRGGKRGTYSGRGIKGQSARAGAKKKPMEREFILRLPKRRGLRFKRPKRDRIVTLSLELVAKYFADGDSVNPKTLREKGLIRLRGGRLPVVKLLGTGKLAKKLLVTQCLVSQSSKAAIEAAGGRVEKLKSRK